MASEYRRASELKQQGINNVRQYSQVTKTPSFPKKERAIFLNVNDTLKLNDYVIAIGNIIQAKNILFASRISNNRICIYLSTVEYVDTITQQTSIKITGLDIGLRRLITPAKRLILSNVCPSIPHDYLRKGDFKIRVYRSLSHVISPSRNFWRRIRTRAEFSSANIYYAKQ